MAKQTRHKVCVSEEACRAAAAAAPGPAKDPVKIFNATARALMKQIDVIFPHETALNFIQEELKMYSAKTCKTPFVPAMKFYKSMKIKTGIKDPKGNELVLGDMILNHDERLFSDECTADIPELRAIDLRSKWKDLNDANRSTLWDYLERMATRSAQVTSEQALKNGELDDITSSIKQIADALPDDMSDEEKIKAVLSDPRLADAAVTINSKLADMGLPAKKK